MSNLLLSQNLIKRAREIQHKELYESKLIEYVKYMWPTVEPSNPLIMGWPMEAICEHLEAVTYGGIRRLLINVPPGFSKSLLTNVFYPSWEWGPKNMPHMRYICASYSHALTERDNVRCRNVILSDRYQLLWGDVFSMSDDVATKIRFANNRTGWKLATSTGGIGVGERGDRFIADDPNQTMEVESDVSRATTNMWFTEVVPDRLNSQERSAIIVIMQRLHEDDVSGTAIARDMGFTHLMIPMEHDPARHCVTVLGIDKDGKEKTWEDPRKGEGELCWEERFPRYIVEELKRDKGKYSWSGQYQQSPEPRGGSIIKREYWQLWEEEKYPTFEYILASADTAYTTKEENDPSALTIWGVFRDTRPQPIGSSADFYKTLPMRVMLLWAWQGRMELNDLVDELMDTCTTSQIPEERMLKREGRPRFPVDCLLIESKASGLSVGQEIWRLLSGRNAPMSVQFPNMNRGKWTQDKIARVYSVQHIFADKIVYAPDRSWADMVINQCALFPKGSHDDLCDTVAQALRFLRDSGMLAREDEQSIADNEEMSYRGREDPLYLPYR